MNTLKTVHVIYKKSAYEIYVKKYHDPHMKQLLERKAPELEWMLAAHEENQAALEQVRGVLKQRNIRARWSYRARREPLEGVDLVLAVGGDGTLLEAARMIANGIPLLGLRSTPSESVGFLCAGDAVDIDLLLDAYCAQQLPLVEASRIQVFHNDEPMLPLALNDILFSHVSPAATSRYIISLDDGLCEEHRSSGVWISSSIGSTAAIHSAGGEMMPPEDPRLQFVVREHYCPQQYDAAQLLQGFIEPGQRLTLCSQMRQAHLFFDGPWVKRPVYFGDTLHFQRAPEPLLLVAPSRMYEAR